MAALTCGDAAPESRRRVSLQRHWRGDLPHLVPVIGPAVQEGHEHGRAGQFGKSHHPWQQLGSGAEEGNIDGAGPFVIQRRRVD